MKKNILLCIALCGMSAFILTGCDSVSKADKQEDVVTVYETESEETAETAESEESTERVTESNRIVSPLPVTIDMNNLDNCTVAVSFEQGDAYVDDTGIMQMDVTVYDYDLYDMVDIASLKEGDILVIQGQEVTITSLERTENGLLINGGLDSGGYELRTDEDTVWYESGYNDAKSYYELGEATIQVSADMIFYDNSDLDKGEVMYYPGDLLTDDADIMYHFVPNNTSIVIENGMIIEMHRSYMP